MLKSQFFGAVFIGGVGVLTYLRFGRPWVLNWGSTTDEATMALPGDDVLEHFAVQTTRAVTIDTSPEYIWPWLVQMGPRPRAGAYTYDWIERLLGIDIENSDSILSEFQQLDPGESFVSKGRVGIEVLEVRPREALVLLWLPASSTWTFVLKSDGATTRLLSRNRIPGSGIRFWIGMAFMEAGSLVMERKMLLGIKERAERLAAGQ